jgi:phytanoyl-CoA hydroxylase
VLVHQSLTIHRAAGNNSEPRTRQPVGLVYYSGAAREDKAAQEAYQQKLQHELAAAGKI